METMAPEVVPVTAMPTSVTASCEEAATRSIVTMKEGSNTVVILFGWAGCRDRYLSKYAQYYEEAGYSTIRFTVPIAKVRSFQSYVHYASVFYNETLGAGMKMPENVLVHVFSMNGCSLFATFWDLLDTKEGGPEIKAAVKGVLYDSSPAHTSPAQSAHAISVATLPPSHYHMALRESYRAVLFTFFSLHRGVMWLRSFMDSTVYEKNFAYFRMLNMKDLPKRQLYLYGPGDEVCSAESIEFFAAEMKSRGATVVLQNMENSLHCQHYRTHPELYQNACLSFIKSSTEEKAEK